MDRVTDLTTTSIKEDKRQKMKDALFTLITIFGLSTVCFAQQSSASTVVLPDKVGIPLLREKICKGKIESISVANSKNGTPAEITVLDESGQRMKFVVKSGTTISDEDDKTPSLDKIGKEDNVIIEYSTTQDDSNVAQSVKSVE